MKIEVETNVGAMKLPVSFPTDDGTCLGKPTICIQYLGYSVVIEQAQFEKLCKAYKKELKEVNK